MISDTIALEEIVLKRGGSVNPKKHPNEVFDLYSIPAFDAGTTEIVPGSEIGSSKKVVRARDVMISRIIPHIRRAWVVRESSGHRQIASGEWIIFRSEKVWPEYLRWVLVGDAFHSAFMRTVSGVGGSLLRARPVLVEKIRIPLPPLAEQQRIARILDAADALRSKRRDSLAQLDILLQSVFLDMFGDPVTNPKGWRGVPLDQIGDFVSGGTPSKARIDFWVGSTPWVSPKDMKVSQISDAQDHISEEAFQETNLKLVQPGCLLIVVRGMILAHSFPVAINRVPVAINQDMKAIRPTEDFDVDFLLACVQGLRRQILSEVSTAGHGTKRFNAQAMKTIAVPLPPIELQLRFASIAGSIERARAHLQAHLTELDMLFACLESRAFRGEL